MSHFPAKKKSDTVLHLEQWAAQKQKCFAKTSKGLTLPNLIFTCLMLHAMSLIFEIDNKWKSQLKFTRVEFAKAHL